MEREELAFFVGIPCANEAFKLHFYVVGAKQFTLEHLAIPLLYI